MITSGQLQWLAGLLEGEGHFGQEWNHGHTGRRIKIILGMTDQDIVQRAGALVGVEKFQVVQRRRIDGTLYRPLYKWSICGARAAGVALTLYPLLGTRRKEQIRKALTAWKLVPVSHRYKPRCHRGHEYALVPRADGGFKRTCRACDVRREVERNRRRRAGVGK